MTCAELHDDMVIGWIERFEELGVTDFDVIKDDEGNKVLVISHCDQVVHAVLHDDMPGADLMVATLWIVEQVAQAWCVFMCDVCHKNRWHNYRTLPMPIADQDKMLQAGDKTVCSDCYEIVMAAHEGQQ